MRIHLNLLCLFFAMVVVAALAATLTATTIVWSCTLFMAAVLAIAFPTASRLTRWVAMAFCIVLGRHPGPSSWAVILGRHPGPSSCIVRNRYRYPLSSKEAAVVHVAKRTKGAHALRVLLSDGSGLTARQTATQLAAAGHRVEVLTPDRLALTRFTRHVARVHSVPPYGTHPLAWLDAALTVLTRRRFDVLLPTQEQVAVLARHMERVTALGVGLAVPPFAALAQVQDKVSALATLARVGLPQPESLVATTPEELVRTARLPVFVKTPIGTATTGVRRVDSPDDLRQVADALAASGGFDLGGVVVQHPVAGPLVMIQAVYAQGRLLAAHANLRAREGTNGGASSKRSMGLRGDLPAVAAHLATLGETLNWHGALALDAILTPQGPCYIDVNPRLVEPGNAWRAGVDLVDVLLRVSLAARERGESPAAPQPPGRADVRTHQLLLGVLAAAEHGGRRAVLDEVRNAARHTGFYHDSCEELTPTAGDWRAGVPVAAAAVATLIRPGSWRWFAAGAVANYALTPTGWQAILAEDAPRRR